MITLYRIDDEGIEGRFCLKIDNGIRVKNSMMIHLDSKSQQKPASNQLYCWAVASLLYRLLSQEFRKKYTSVECSKPCSRYISREMKKTLPLPSQPSEKTDSVKYNYNEMCKVWWTSHVQDVMITQITPTLSFRDKTFIPRARITLHIK